MAQGTGVTHRTGPEAAAVESLRARIDSERRALDHTLDRLGDRLRETLDWRQQAVRHRGKLIAAGSGLLMAGVWRWRRRRRPRARLQEALARAADAANREACAGLEVIRQRLAAPRRSWMSQMVAPLAMAAVRAALAGRGGNQHAEAERPTPPRGREGEAAAWNQEEKERNRKSNSTIGV